MKGPRKKHPRRFQSSELEFVIVRLVVGLDWQPAEKPQLIFWVDHRVSTAKQLCHPDRSAGEAKRSGETLCFVKAFSIVPLTSRTPS